MKLKKIIEKNRKTINPNELKGINTRSSEYYRQKLIMLIWMTNTIFLLKRWEQLIFKLF
jgi:hypothetical protein